MVIYVHVNGITDDDDERLVVFLLQSKQIVVIAESLEGIENVPDLLPG